MKRVIILKGLQACGKTTWAKEQIDKHPGMYKRISKDDLRAMLDNGKWSKTNEKLILKVRDSLILLALEEGYHLLIDDTNLHEKHITAIRELVTGQAIVEIKDFTHVSLEECIERDRKRPNYVGEKVIRDTYRQFLQPKPTPPVYDPSLPDIVVSDLDGTLALLNGRNPYDASTCEQDVLNAQVAWVLRRAINEGKLVFLVSGRDEEFQPETKQWLSAHEVQYDRLLMRPHGDNRKDAVLKQELYEQHIKGQCNVMLILDDRGSVINLWRSLGLTVFQVAESPD